MQSIDVVVFFFFNDTATTEIYTLSLHDALPIFRDVFCNNFYITTSGNFSNPALLCCVMEMGVDRILFAVDYPFVMNPPGTRWIENVPLSEADKAKILSGNAKRLLRM